MSVLNFVRKIRLSLLWFFQTIYEAITGKISIKYARIKILSQLTLTGKRFIDGVNWNTYNLHYLEELKIIEKTNTTIINSKDVFIDSGKISYINRNQKPLLINHELLYETIIDLNPKSILEVGCGAGDHLANLKSLNQNLECYGTELLEEQLNSLNVRHPNNKFKLNLANITLKECELPKVELVYTNAVLMHITEKKQRFQNALTNIFSAASKHIVLMENWTQHNFYENVKNVLQSQPDYKIYYRAAENDNQTRVMVISKSELEYEPMVDYNDLLVGKLISVH